MLAVVALASLAGCAATADANVDADDGVLQVVASTDVYGSIASAIGGDPVEVTSIIDRPTQDPHSYEATARVQLAVSKADVVIENGGGYDDFVDTLIASADSGSADDSGSTDDSGAVVLNAVELSGMTAAPGLNEHVWYDVPAMRAVATRLIEVFSDLDPENADTFAANGATFTTSLDDLEADAADIAASAGGREVAVTEPVPLYLLDACGLTDVTPGAFSEAVEEGTDVPPAVLATMLDLVADPTLAMLAYNEQTTGPETERVLAAAQDAGVPVVSFGETLPEGADYLTWMSANLDSVRDALDAA